MTISHFSTFQMEVFFGKYAPYAMHLISLFNVSNRDVLFQHYLIVRTVFMNILQNEQLSWQLKDATNSSEMTLLKIIGQ